MERSIFPLLMEEVEYPFYLYAVGVGDGSQGSIIKPAGTPLFEWNYAIAGKGRLYLGNKEYLIPPETGFLLFPNTPHQYYPMEEPWVTHWVVFHGYGVRQLLKTLSISTSGVYYVTNSLLLENMVHEMYNLACNEYTSNRYECHAMIYRFLLEFKRIISKEKPGAKPTNLQLKPVISFMEQNYHQNPTLEEIAAIIDVSPQHLCRLFKQVLGMRPFVLLTKIRIQKAKELLLYGNINSLKELAARVGYRDPSYFCAVFKECEGITPIQYKKTYSRGR